MLGTVQMLDNSVGRELNDSYLNTAAERHAIYLSRYDEAQG